MITYILRRFLYAIPILIGVNLLTFTLFFVVNTPDNMARMQLGIKNVTQNEPFFQGHFPENPIMPGVLIIEAMAQAGAVLAAKSLDREIHDALVYFMGIDKVKFRKPVTPGDQVIFEVKFLKQRAKVFKMAGIAYVDKKVVAEAELMATFGERV